MIGLFMIMIRKTNILKTFFSFLFFISAHTVLKPSLERAFLIETSGELNKGAKILVLSEIHDATSIEQYNNLFKKINFDEYLLEIPTDLCLKKVEEFFDKQLQYFLANKYVNKTQFIDRSIASGFLELEFPLKAELEEMIKENFINIRQENYLGSFLDAMGDPDDFDKEFLKDYIIRYVHSIKTGLSKATIKLPYAAYLTVQLAKNQGLDNFLCTMRFVPNAMLLREQTFAENIMLVANKYASENKKMVLCVLGDKHLEPVYKLLQQQENLILGKIKSFETVGKEFMS